MKRILFIAVLVCSLMGLVSQEIHVPPRGNTVTNSVTTTMSASDVTNLNNFWIGSQGVRLYDFAGGGTLGVSASIWPSADATVSLGDTATRWVSLYLSSSLYTPGGILADSAYITNSFYNKSFFTNTLWAAIGTTMTNFGSIVAVSNIIIQAGGSNVFVGGTLFQSTIAFTNLNSTSATLTNLGNTTIGAHTLTNNGDGFRAIWSGRMTNGVAVPNTNEFKIVFGSTTILDTGLQPSTNIPFYAWVEVTRTGNTAQHADAHFEWGPGGGIPWAFTNVNMELAETNGIATVLALQGASTIKAAHTNTFFKVSYIPASR